MLCSCRLLCPHVINMLGNLSGEVLKAKSACQFSSGTLITLLLCPQITAG